MKCQLGAPERSALAAHLTALQGASEQMTAARKRLDKARAQIESAQIAQRTAQAHLNEIAERETATVRDWATEGGAWPPPASPALTNERQEAQGRIDEVGRVLASLQPLLQEAESELAEPAQAFAKLSLATEDHVIGVLEDEMTAAVTRLQSAYDTVSEAEAAVAGARNFIAEHGAKLRDQGAPTDRFVAWFQLGGRVTDALAKVHLPGPTVKDQAAASAAWQRLSLALATDAGAQLKDRCNAH